MKTLICKLGASGDVVRTTSILNKIEGEIFWITKKPNDELLPKLKNLHCIDIEEISLISDQNFDLILSLEDSFEDVSILSHLKTKKTVGTFILGDEVSYTEDSSPWFDMGLNSFHGIKKADELKKTNTKTYQEFLFEMLGFKFSGEPSLINLSNTNKRKNLIGIEQRSGDRWPSKMWNGYFKLSEALKNEGFSVRILKQRESLSEYIKDIKECEFLFCGDTLAMHIGLATQCKVFGIFLCTPPQEIYDYNLLSKIVSPDIFEFLYTPKYNKNLIDSVDVNQVLSTFKSKLI
jgi:heptosyltransferase II